MEAFAGSGPMRVLLETGTESEWVAQALEAAGHTVIVADPNYAPMYGELRRKVKTDRRDVAALAEANRRGWYRATHRASAAQRAVRQVLRSRRQLVQMRSGHDLVAPRAAAAVGLSVGVGQLPSGCRRGWRSWRCRRRWPRRSRRCGGDRDVDEEIARSRCAVCRRWRAGGPGRAAAADGAGGRAGRRADVPGVCR